MKHKAFYIITAGVVVIFIVLGIASAAKFIAKRELKNIFKEAEVSIRQVSIRPLGFVEFSDITINKPSAYNIKCKHASVQYNLKKYL